MKNLYKISSSILSFNQESIHFDDYGSEGCTIYNFPLLKDNSESQFKKNSYCDEWLRRRSNQKENNLRSSFSSRLTAETFSDVCINTLLKADKDSIGAEEETSFGGDSDTEFTFQTPRSSIVSNDRLTKEKMDLFLTKKKPESFAGLKRQFRKIHLSSKQSFRESSAFNLIKFRIRKNPEISLPICIEGRPSLIHNEKHEKFNLIKSSGTVETPIYDRFAKYNNQVEIPYSKPEIGSTAETFEQFTDKLFKGIF
ncbi:hypothetical protein G6F46_011806 [Rhizopus delemar]|uniref:Uncharacterized protein n=2 Tax=Rhizopus TaxID=4842 RepID=A0A9P6YSW5_9FUNG|nr:hypothetical protein G6F55_011415 [Rhizopus delemar]KAG1534808.1 hypothetical protein G6F51_011884 [Rhizopus arrhizus]KAG1489265.1 hypothetical protein G6F54_011560 [Rhizopus delemar]KAG1508798.1 hypothetical protein G6F53_007917 [Rhizopus delemar]KAG1511931.1 hypothetical protein G6F52_010531 [Rhizopus delemar]